tara:strand:+ start:178 stop:561 length:384 start_codon:yes stop_codon:yes gene_type:complete
MNIQHNEIKEKLFLDGLNLFNKKQFYDAHEIWEELWTEYRQVDDKFIQGLIQLSVGYFHILNINKRGAISLFNKSLSKFELFKGIHRNLDVDLIIDSINETLNNLEEINEIKDFSWDKVKTIEFVNE